VRKRDCYRAYRQLIGDEWSDLLRVIYEICKDEWAYRIPGAPGDRQALRAICERTLGFENHFMRVFKDFVLEELCGDDAEGRRDARRLLGQIPFDDRDIMEALHTQKASRELQLVIRCTASSTGDSDDCRAIG
jgi:hypothetical protein